MTKTSHRLLFLLRFPGLITPSIPFFAFLLLFFYTYIYKWLNIRWKRIRTSLFWLRVRFLRTTVGYFLAWFQRQKFACDSSNGRVTLSPHHPTTPPLSLSAPFPRIHYSFYPTLTLKWICCLIIMNYRNAFGYCDWKCICTDYAHWFIRIPLKARIIIMQKCWIIHRNELHSLPLSLSDPFHWIYYSSYFTFRL